MSVKISGKVWELDIDATEKIILLALAEYADHEGNNVRPGNSLLVAMTGLTQQTISTKITKFVEAGILDPDEYGGGRGALRQFTIDPSHGKRRQYFIDKEQKKLQRSRTLPKPETYKQGVASEGENYNQGVPSGAERYNLTGQKVQSDSGKVQSDSCAYKEENRHEPSEEPLVINQPLAEPTKDTRSKHPAIALCRKITERYPKKEVWDLLIEALGESPDEERLKACRLEWIKRGFNSNAWTWAVDWYRDGIPQNGNGHNFRFGSKAEQLARQNEAAGEAWLARRNAQGSDYIDVEVLS